MARIPRILTITRCGQVDPRVLDASARAGALGIVDPGEPLGEGRSGLRELLERASVVLSSGRPFGLRIETAALVAGAIEDLSANVRLLVVVPAAGDIGEWSAIRKRVRKARRLALAEVRSAGEANAAVVAGFRRLLLVGQEAGGWTGSEEAPALLRTVCAQHGERCQVWLRGGIGPESAAALVAAGAAGVVLDGALLLARESVLPEPLRAILARGGAVSTTLFGRPGGARFRGFLAAGLLPGVLPEEVDVAPGSAFWQGVGWDAGQVWPLGTDAALAAELAGRHVTVGGIIRAVGQAIDETVRPRSASAAPRRPRQRPSDVAIIGMSAVVPGAADVRSFWQNTLIGRDAITEVPADRWDWRLYFDADPKAPDRIVSRWGGFVPEIPFDPLVYGMPPASLPSIEPLHLLTLEAVRAAIDDAGYRDRPFPRERTAVVLGAGGGAAQLAMGYAFRSYLPLLDTVVPGLGTEVLERAGALLPEWTEDSFPGILLNVAAGRVANRFDLGGANYTVDAACGSSLAAAALAVRELESGAADMVVLGGADTVQNPFTYLAFSKTQAFSPRGRCRPFDAKADGIVISEAVAVVILKRLADAERDGDRIYAVIKGLGASSDGRAKGLTAPRFEGQVRALRRAYEKAGVSPAEIGYVEAHGTGTAAGDLAETQALAHVFGKAQAGRNRCALGSVKSLIGHTKCAAGLAGLINATLALHHRVLPPTIGIETPNPRVDFAGSPFHLSTRARPWLRSDLARPRRAGVSAFGFGGTNFHAVLEAYEGDPAPPAPARLEWPAELLVWQRRDRRELAAELAVLGRALGGPAVPPLRSIAATLAARLDPQWSGCVLAIVATSTSDLGEKLRRAMASLETGVATIHDPSGIEFAERPPFSGNPVACLFPGQGSQYPGMLEELAIVFPTILETVEDVDRALTERGRRAVGPVAFPPPAWDEAERLRQKTALAATDVAQPALGAVEVGLFRLLRALGFAPGMLGGHSYGELVALHAAGVYSLPALAELSEARGRLLLEAAGTEPGAMAAVAAGDEVVATLIAGNRGVVVANRNGPAQTVVSGPRAAIDRVVDAARARQVRAQVLPVSCAFHSPMIAGAREPLARLVACLGPKSPTLPVHSNLDAAVYGSDPAAIAQRVGDHAASEVRFAAMVESMHAAGARVFAEVGPGNVLTGLVDSILGDRPHLAVCFDAPARRGVAGLIGGLAQMCAGGVPLDLRPLTAGRAARMVSWGQNGFEPFEPAHSPTTWLVNGNRARPAAGPETPRFGTGPALPKPAARISVRSKQPALPASPPAFEAPSGAPADQVLAAFQTTMRNFLDVQRSTMLRLLANRPAATPQPAAAAQAPPVESPARAPASAIPPAPVEEPAPDRNGHETGAIASTLLEIVRARTGYPLEMLQLDLDLEADLGIDSIKRVEILGTLRESLGARTNGSESELMDQLARARTLGAIVERLGQFHDVPRDGRAARNGDAKAEPSVERPQASPLQRMLLEAVDVPAAEVGLAQLAERRTVLLTDDGRGIVDRLASRLRRDGFRATVLKHGDRAPFVPTQDGFSLDLADQESVARLGKLVRARGALTALVHARTLHAAETPGLDAHAWASRLRSEALALFVLAREFAPDLAAAAQCEGSALVAATAMGGALGSLPPRSAHWFPGQGAVTGLVKTLAREWPGVRTRVVDFDPRDDVRSIAANLFDELFLDDARTEVGYCDGRRAALDVVERPLDTSESNGFELAPHESVVITGGARGITAAVAADLAARWRPTMLLIGSTPPPGGSESSATAGIDDPAALKSVLLAQLERTGSRPTPIDLERAYRGLLREREIRANLATLRRLGATVDYAQADVRDAAALAALLDRWRTRFGPPAGLIHGAGVIQDKLLRDKTPESIERVISTKLDGALNLARLLDAHPPRFTAFFSSVAGRFGNRGQTDYAAANDALNKLALWLDDRWPGRVVSMIWGPWSGIGMVSDLEAHLGRRGLGMIDPIEGSTRLAAELCHGRKGEVEVVVASELGNLLCPVEAKVAP